MSGNPAYMPPQRSAVFDRDAACPDGYLLVESVNANHSRPHTHLAQYESVSAMARGVIAARATTLCDKAIRRDWSWVASKREDGTVRKTTCRACRACLAAVRKALA